MIIAAVNYSPKYQLQQQELPAEEENLPQVRGTRLPENEIADFARAYMLTLRTRSTHGLTLHGSNGKISLKAQLDPSSTSFGIMLSLQVSSSSSPGSNFHR